MLPELGHFALVLALILAGLQAFFGIVGPALGRGPLGVNGDQFGRGRTICHGGHRGRHPGVRLRQF